MEPENSLQLSQVPATCPYPETVHVPTSNFLKIHLNIILPSTPGYKKCSAYVTYKQLGVAVYFLH